METGSPDGRRPDGRLRGADGIVDALLPVPTVQCHAPNLARLPGGDLACVWFGGTQEGTHDTAVYLSRLADADATWAPARLLSTDGERSEQNPVLFAAPGGSVWLLYTAQRAGHQDTAEIRCRISDDDGVTWTDPRTLIPSDGQGGVFVRQPVTALPDGRWLMPVFRCVSRPGAAWVGDADSSSVFVSEDQGRSWAEHPVPGSTGAVHMNVLKLADGYLALYRSRWADHIYASRSEDAIEWTAPVPTALPNNNSSIQAAVLPGGRIALVHNNSSAADATGRRESLYDEIGDDGTVRQAAAAQQSEPRQQAAPYARGAGPTPGARRAFWGAPRAPLTLSVSGDGGSSWPWQRDLATGDGYCLTNDSRHGANRELSYPSICADPDGTVHVAYTHHRRAIRYLRLDPGWLRAQPGAPR